MKFNPVQTNQMPVILKLKNMAWKFVNKSFLDSRPPF